MPRGISRLDEARHQKRLWTPAHLRSKAHVWCDAQDLSTFSYATGVSQWRDKSGNGRHASEATGAEQPTLAYAGINGQPALFFSGTGMQGLRSTIALTGSSVAAFAVTKTVGAVHQLNMRLVSISNLGGTADYNTSAGMALLSYYDNPLPGVLYSYTSLGQVGTNLSFPTDVAMVAAAIGNGSVWQLWGHGTSTASTSFTPTFNSTSFGIGIDASADLDPWYGYIGEALLLDYAPTTFEQQRIEGYMAHRWLTTADLPASHPYRNSPPLIGT